MGNSKYIFILNMAAKPRGSDLLRVFKYSYMVFIKVCEDRETILRRCENVPIMMR